MSKIIKPKSFFLEALPLFLILFIDGMGLSLVFPIFNILIMDPSSGFLALSISNGMRNFIYGITIGVFMICWFFGAAFLGDLSDQIGRKKSLLICLLGATLSYALSSFAVLENSYILLLIGRIIAGFTAGSQPIAQAAIVDISSPEHKSRNIGFILLAISLGFIFGPIIGGVLSDTTISNHFSLAAPFYFATLISTLNAIMLISLFQETFILNKKVKLKLHRAIEIFISAFKNEKVNHLSLIFFVFAFSWSCYYSFISLFLLKTYHFNTASLSYFMGVLGIGFGIGNGFLADYCVKKRYSLKKSIMTGLIAEAILILITAAIQSSFVAWLMVIPVGIAGSTAYVLVITLFSNQVDKDSQGWVMGITGSIMAASFGVSGVCVAILASINAALPLYLGAFGMGLSTLLMWKMYKENKRGQVHT